MEKKPTGRILALIAVGILPALTVILGILLLCNGLILHPLNVLTFFLLPGLTFGICFLMIRSRKKLWLKWLVCILALFLFVQATVYLIILGPYREREYWTGNDALAKYQESAALFPYAIPDIGQPDALEFQFYFKLFGIFFDTETYTLICHYTEPDYLAQKEHLEQTYRFHTEPLYGHENATLPAEHETDGYLFRFLSFDREEYGLEYPKYMTLLGFSDDTHEIVYLYFDDDDLDYISSWDSFLTTDCGWDHIR